MIVLPYINRLVGVIGSYVTNLALHFYDRSIMAVVSLYVFASFGCSCIPPGGMARAPGEEKAGSLDYAAPFVEDAASKG